MQFLKIGAVEQKVGLKKSEIYKRISRGDFPEPIHLGRKSSVWVDEEVEAWMARKVAEALSASSRKPSAPATPPRSRPPKAAKK